jgi:nucleoside-diphosphate-sugar epimerase
MTTDNSSTTVLVTGASGFVGLHCTLLLLEKGYRVRGTVRSLSRESHLREVLGRHVDVGDRLSFAATDLMKDDGWDAAVEGCEYVLHIASPVLAGPPRHPDDLVIPARDGTLRLLGAAASAGVKRVVLTSSLAAVIAGYSEYGRVFDESDWSDTDGDISAYSLSKTLAEQAAWEFVKGQDSERPLELAVLNPGYILGPVLDGSHQLVASGEIVYKLMQRELPGAPDLNFHMVDVRDVAGAHLKAMTMPEAVGKRFCCFSEYVEMQEVALILDRHFSGRGYKIPTRRIPNIAVRIIALFDETARLVVRYLGHRVEISTERIRGELDWQPRPAEEAVVDMAESMIEHGLV